MGCRINNCIGAHYGKGLCNKHQGYFPAPTTRIEWTGNIQVHHPVRPKP